MQQFSDSYPTVGEVLDSHIEEIPRLHRPVMLVALQGWFDAAKAATGALDWLMDGRNCVTVANIESDPFFDFTQARPEVWMDEDEERHIRWPQNEVIVVHGESDDRDLVVISGVEPHLHWPTFVACIVKCAKDLHCAAVVTVGAMLDAVPHTRTPIVTGSTTSNALASKLGLSRPQYEGPTGVIGVLQERLEHEKIPAVSLRVGVPHYLASSEHPKSSAALLRHLERVLGVPTQHAGLYEDIQRWAELHDAAVEEDEQTAQYVNMLEREYDRRNDTVLPSADDLGNAFEQFLREQDED